MIVLKIIGILLAITFFLIVFVLLQSVRVVFSFSTKGKRDLKAKILFFSLYDMNKKPKKAKKEKTNKKPSKISAYFKKLFGLDAIDDATKIKENTEKEGISETVDKIVAAFSLLFGRISWLLGKINVKRFHILAICGGSDAADVAMEYGMVCAAIYPLMGYIETNLNVKENATDVRIGCDFENEAYFEIEFKAKLRLIHIVRAVLRNAKKMAEKQAGLEANI